MAILAELAVAADVDAWRAVGISVDADGTATVGSVRLRFEPVVAGPGVQGWGLAALAGPAPAEVADLTTWAVDDPPAPAPADAHPLGLERLDHLVVLTPDLAATVAAVEAGLGIRLRRQREGLSGSGVPSQQAFFRLGEAILELVAGPPGEPTRFWGLAFEVASLDAAHARLGPERLRPPKAAVQPGWRIASLRAAAGLGLPVALMDTPPGR